MTGKQSREQEIHRVAGSLFLKIRQFQGAIVSSIGGFVGKITLRSLIAVPILFFALLILLETVRGRNVSFAPILVPEELSGIGYTPRVVSQRLIDRVHSVYDESIRSMSYAEKQAVERMPMVHSQPTIDLALPTLDISVSSFAAYLRNLLRLNDHFVTGEILFHTSKERVSLRLRLDGQEIFESSGAFDDADINELFDLGAYEIIKHIEPFVLARFFYSAEEKEKARDVITFMHSNPESSKHYIEAVVLEAVLLSDEEQFDDAFRVFRMATELRPKYVTAFVNWGNTLVKANDHGAAVEKFEEALQIDPTYKQAFLSWGLSLKKQGRFDGAIAKYKKAVQSDPDFTSAYVNWGNALAEKRNYAKAIKKYRKALQLTPDHAIAYFNWGTTLLECGDLSGAIDRFWRAVRVDRDLVHGYVALGNALASRGEIERAIDHYQEAIQVDPNHAPAYDFWGLAHFRRREYSEAIDQFKEAISHDPKLTTAYVNLGMALAEQGNLREAEEKYEYAIELDPAFAPAFYHWSVLLARRGHCEKASQKYEKAKNIDSSLTPPICKGVKGTQ